MGTELSMNLSRCSMRSTIINTSTNPIKLMNRIFKNCFIKYISNRFIIILKFAGSEFHNI